MSELLTPYRLNNAITLQNRIVMAPMTRNMAHDDLSPTQAMADYYARRSQAGLIVTEGTIICPGSKGFSNVPGIFTAEQINGWRRVTDQVHAQGGQIFSQIWHVGRVSHPSFLNGELPISASATQMTGLLNRALHLQFGWSRAASELELTEIVEQFAQAARNAREAGFDGVEIHGANGYLIDQFLHHSTNLRTDQYGETPENMARFALEVVKACGDAIGFDRVAIRLSPGAYLNQIVGDARDAAVFRYLLTELNKLNIAYVHTGNFNDKAVFAELDNLTMTAFLRRNYHGNLIACGAYTPQEAAQGIAQNAFDLIALGRPFIANPDLISRLQNNREMEAYDAHMLAELL